MVSLLSYTVNGTSKERICTRLYLNQTLNTYFIGMISVLTAETCNIQPLEHWHLFWGRTSSIIAVLLYNRIEIWCLGEQRRAGNRSTGLCDFILNVHLRFKCGRRCSQIGHTRLQHWATRKQASLLCAPTYSSKPPRLSLSSSCRGQKNNTSYGAVSRLFLGSCICTVRDLSSCETRRLCDRR